MVLSSNKLRNTSVPYFDNDTIQYLTLDSDTQNCQHEPQKYFDNRGKNITYVNIVKPEILLSYCVIQK